MALTLSIVIHTTHDCASTNHKLVLALSVDATKRRLKISKISPPSNPQTEEQF